MPGDAAIDRRDCSRFCSSSCVLRVSRRFFATTCASVSPLHAVCYPMRAICGGGQAVTPRQRAHPAEPCHRGPLGGFLKGLSFTRAARCSIPLLENTSLKLLPFATADAFDNPLPARTKPDVVTVFSSTRLPGFSGRDFLTTTGSSATSHRVGLFLSCLLKRTYRSHRCHAPIAGRCQASPVTVLTPRR